MGVTGGESNGEQPGSCGSDASKQAERGGTRNGLAVGGATRGDRSMDDDVSPLGRVDGTRRSAGSEDTFHMRRRVEDVLTTISPALQEDLSSVSKGSAWSFLYPSEDVENELNLSREQRNAKGMLSIAIALVRMGAITAGGPTRGPRLRGVPREVIKEISPLLALVVERMEQEYAASLGRSQGKADFRRHMSVLGQMVTMSIALTFPVNIDSSMEAHNYSSTLFSSMEDSSSSGGGSSDEEMEGSEERRSNESFITQMVRVAASQTFDENLPLFFHSANGCSIGIDDDSPFPSLDDEEDEDEDDFEEKQEDEMWVDDGDDEEQGKRSIETSWTLFRCSRDGDAYIARCPGATDVHFNPAVISSFFSDAFFFKEGMVLSWLTILSALHQSKSIANFCDRADHIFGVFRVLLAIPSNWERDIRLSFCVDAAREHLKAGGRTALEKKVVGLAHREGPLRSSEVDVGILEGNLMTATEPGHALRAAVDRACKLFELMPIDVLKLMEHSHASSTVPYFHHDFRAGLLPWAREVQRMVYLILLLSSPGQRCEAYDLDMRTTFVEHCHDDGLVLGAAHPLSEKRQRRLFNLPLSTTAINAITLFVLGARKVLMGFNCPDVTSVFVATPKGNDPGRSYEKNLGVGQDARRAANDAFYFTEEEDSSFDTAQKTAKGNRYSRSKHVNTGFPSISASVLRRTTLTFLLHPDNIDALLQLGDAGSPEVIQALYNTSAEVIHKHYLHQGIELEKRPQLLTAWLTAATDSPEMQAFVRDLLPTALAELNEEQSSSYSTSVHLDDNFQGPSATAAAALRGQFNCSAAVSNNSPLIAVTAIGHGSILRTMLTPLIKTTPVQRRVFHTERDDGRLFRVPPPHAGQLNQLSAPIEAVSRRALNDDVGFVDTKRVQRVAVSKGQLDLIGRFYASGHGTPDAF